MKRKVYLEGEIGEKFGKEFTLDVDSFKEVIKCLDCNFSELRPYLVECHENGIGFVCEVDNTPITNDAELLLHYPTGDMTIRALPTGSDGIAKIVLGAVLVALLFVPGVGAVVGGAAGSTIFGAATAVGASGLAIGAALGLAVLGGALLMQGLTEMMAPDPAVDSGGTQKEDSYLFQGAGQTIVEGDPLPILYGELRIPGRPISFQTANATAVFVHREAIVDASGTPLTGNIPDNQTEQGTNPLNTNDPIGGGGGGDQGGGNATDVNIWNQYNLEQLAEQIRYNLIQGV
tara:strand:- start:10435 stop:11301 length:867 start_codon:yes stop_codon:yes gene_type:complete